MSFVCKNNNYIVSIEGNIGSGKSTILQWVAHHFRDNSSIVFVDEPINDWNTIKDEDGTTLFEKFYKEPHRYSFPFQVLAINSRIQAIKSAIDTNKNSIIITERSLYADHLIFARRLHDIGHISKIEYDIYMKSYNTFIAEYPVYLLLYLDTPPDMCMERLQERNRFGECKITMNYIESCDAYHKRFILTNIAKDNIYDNGTIELYKNDSEENYPSKYKIILNGRYKNDHDNDEPGWLNEINVMLCAVVYTFKNMLKTRV